MTLINLFLDAVKEHQSRIAFVYRQRYRLMRWSYGDLERHVKIIAAALAKEKIEKGDRVLLFAPNSPYWVAAYFAILARGAVVVPLNIQSTPEQLNKVLKNCEPKLLLQSLRSPWPAKKLASLTLEVVATQPSPLQLPKIDTGISNENDIAEIVYTSGTTGDPKGVVLTHQNLTSNAQALSRAIPLLSSDHLLNILPLFHMYAQMASMIYPMLFGASVTFIPGPYSRAISQALADTRTTHLVAVPEFLQVMMRRIEQGIEKKHLSGLFRSEFIARLPQSLRRALWYPVRRRLSPTLHSLTSGGAPLDPKVEEKWRMLGFEMLQGYGLTETSPSLTINTYTEHRIGSVGKPLDNVEIKIDNDGEILVRGPSVMAEYYKNPKKTAEAFEGDWFKTDDQGKIDEDGYVYVYGRKKYMIVTAAGENVFPEDIEAILNRQPGIKDSAVVGIEKAGRIEIHAVLLCDTCNPKDVVDATNKQLAPHQQITAWSLWPESDFPRSATRKVKKQMVIEWLQQRKVELKAQAKLETTPLIRLLAQITSSATAEINPDSRLGTDLKIDSLLRIELVSRLEEEFNAVIEEPEIIADTTVADLQSLIDQRKGIASPISPGLRWSAQKWVRSIGSFIQTVILFGYISLFVKLKVEGIKNLPPQTMILMPNHRSFIDAVVVLKALPARQRRKVALAAAKDVLYQKYAYGAKLVDLVFHSFPLPRQEQENIMPGLQYAGHLLDEGYSVMVFPEGRVNLTDQPLESLKLGAGLMAIEMGTPVVPVMISGSEAVLPPGRIFLRHRGTVRIRFGEAMYFSPAESYSQATAQIEQALKKLFSSNKE